MNQYPDMRYHDEQEMYQYYKSLDYSKVTDWKVLFSTRENYQKAFTDKNHPFHEEAKQIRKNRSYKNALEMNTTNTISMGEEAYQTYKTLG